MQTREVQTLFGSSGAVFSDCGRYRYLLWRVWDASLPRALLLMMNPSTADETENDPTIERQVRRLQQWPQQGVALQVGGLEVANVFAYRETDSRKLAGLHAQGVDLVGPDNDAQILAAAQRAAIIICGWGKPGRLGGRDAQVLAMLGAAGMQAHALQLNQDGSPTHPLYVGYEALPIPIPTPAAA